MSITIPESGLRFGPFTENNVFQVEKSILYEFLGENIKTVEFILYERDSKILFIEAKSSSPKPGNGQDFNEFIDDVCVKFAHSIDIFFSLLVNRLSDEKGEMPNRFREVDYTICNIKLILVINGHELPWLSPITDALKRALKPQLRIWGLEITVLNHELAQRYGLTIA